MRTKRSRVTPSCDLGALRVNALKASPEGHKGRTKVLVAAALAGAMLLGCSSDNPPKNEAANSAQTEPSQKSVKEFAIPPLTSGLGPQLHVDEQRAWQYAKELVAFGTRPIGSAGHKKVEEYITGRLKGVDVSDDAFTAQTPAGALPVRNLIAKFPGKKDGIIVIATHYDTNYPLPKTYVGANDGGAPSALLLELANQLKSAPRDGYSVWLVWTDAEEAVKTWTDADSLYGTRHLVDVWDKDGTLKKIKAFILLDMIADKDLNVDRDSASTPWLEDLVGQAAKERGFGSYFFGREVGMEDDHIPFKQKGVPVADLIDFEYGYGNVFWHTPDDTLDKCSPQSLKIVGDVTLEMVRQLDAR